MKLRHLGSLVTVLALTAGSVAHAQFKVVQTLQQGIEAAAGSVALPADESGALLVTPCDKCAAISLRSSARSEYVLGSQRVSLATFKRALVDRPDELLVVTYTTRDKALTRVIAMNVAAP